MGYDVWARFDNPDEYGEGYADAIEEALRTSGREQITFEDVQNKFLDMKRSATARERIKNYMGDYEARPSYFSRLTPSRFAEISSHAESLYYNWYATGKQPKSANYIRFLEDERTFWSGKPNGPEELHWDGSTGHPAREVVTLYSTLWPNLIRKLGEEEFEFVNSSLGTAGGDTMNSFTYVFKSAMGVAQNKKAAVAFERYEREGIESPVIEEQLSMLAYLTHTAGNFIPMPGNKDEGSSFTLNQARGLQCRTTIGDYWDLTIECIRRYYLAVTLKPDGSYEIEGDKAQSPLLGVLNGNGTADRHLFQWLKHCGGGEFGENGWRKFVDYNYLKDYVTADYEVVRYINGSSRFNFEQKTTHPNDANIEECLIKMNARIIARGIRMRQATAKKPYDFDADLRFIFGW